MAARFGAKIVPFGAVGEDDFGQVRFALGFYPFVARNGGDLIAIVNSRSNGHDRRKKIKKI